MLEALPFGRSIFILAVSALVVAGCGKEAAEPRVSDPAAAAESAPIAVAVVNYPLAYFAERIGGEHVQVLFPAPPDEDPAYWTPDPETVARYQQVDLLLLNGAGYAKWVETATLPASKLVDTSAAFEDRLLRTEGELTHTHGPGGEHAHGGTAFTTWLDPELAAMQAKAVKEALARRRPELEAEFQRRYGALAEELAALDERLAAAVVAAPDLPVIFSHPVYQYLTARYGLNGVSVHWEPDEAPSASQWRELATLRADHPAEWMIWEGEPLEETVRRLEGMGVRSVVFDPCGNAPEEGDLLEVMERNLGALEEVYGG
jgi:zinc transport system substrate-binding protein